MAGRSEQYQTEISWGGWALAGVFLVGVLPLEAGVVLSGVPGTITGSIPFALLVLYVLAAVAVNRTSVTVTRQGIRRFYVGLPTGETELWIPREDVTKVYVREVEIRGRTTVRYKVAGVETKQGWWVDLSDDREPARSAEAIAGALGWQPGVVQLAGRAPRTRGVALRIAMRVAGVLALSIFWLIQR
jgi:hypothetical protein